VKKATKKLCTLVCKNWKHAVGYVCIAVLKSVNVSKKKSVNVLKKKIFNVQKKRHHLPAT